MKLDRFIGSVWYKQKLILVDDYCNKLTECTAETLYKKGGFLLNRNIDVFKANNNGDIVITLKKDSEYE